MNQKKKKKTQLFFKHQCCVCVCAKDSFVLNCSTFETLFLFFYFDFTKYLVCVWLWWKKKNISISFEKHSSSSWSLSFTNNHSSFFYVRFVLFQKNQQQQVLVSSLDWRCVNIFVCLNCLNHQRNRTS